MLMVLMALVELGRTKVHLATRWLWLLFSGGLVVAPLSCGPEEDDSGTGITATDTWTPPKDVPGDVPQVLYGPPPVDAWEGAAPDADVAPVDVPDAAPADVRNDCEFMAIYYGPAQCTSDAQCVAEHGANWYCAKGTVDLGCGNKVEWNSCVEQVDADVPLQKDVATADCEPLVAYGPPPCTSDADCQKYGSEWYCGTQEVVIDSCGTKVMANRCMQSVDVVAPDVPKDVEVGPDCGPPMEYGPQPLYGMPACFSDDDCVKKGFPQGTKCVSEPCNPFSAACVPPK